MKTHLYIYVYTCIYILVYCCAEHFCDGHPTLLLRNKSSACVTSNRAVCSWRVRKKSLLEDSHQ